MDWLLDLNDQIMEVGEGYWVEIRAHRVPASDTKPHGIDYSLCLLSPEGERLVCYDNSHPVKKGQGRFSPMSDTNDHAHERGKVRPYQYQDAATLVSDFWDDVNRVLKEEGVP